MTSPQRCKNLDLVEQDYGGRPLEQRESHQYEKEYVQSFVEKWDELIDWEGRAKGEGRFFVELLQRRGKQKVLDVATGTGFHSVQLLKSGFEVASVDGSAQMLSQAFQNARDHNFILRTTLADWRWLNRDVHEKYDAIICLGNSFTHLFSERDRRRTLAEFYAALRHDGILILDQRNYDAILDVGFDAKKHTYYYCGESVSAQPDHVDEGLCRFRYDFSDGQTFYLNMFPLRKEYTRNLLMEVGFTAVETYGDFQQTHREEEPDFFIHVAEKTYNP